MPKPELKAFEIQGLYPLPDHRTGVTVKNRMWKTHSHADTLERGKSSLPTWSQTEGSWRVIDLTTGLVVYPEAMAGAQAEGLMVYLVEGNWLARRGGSREWSKRDEFATLEEAKKSLTYWATKYERYDETSPIAYRIVDIRTGVVLAQKEAKDAPSSGKEIRLTIADLKKAIIQYEKALLATTSLKQKTIMGKAWEHVEDARRRGEGDVF